MGLIQVDTFTVTSAVANVIIGGGSSGSSSNNFAINTNDVYQLVYRDLFMSNDGAGAHIRLTVSGSADTSSNYDRAYSAIYANQNIYNTANANAAQFNGSGQGTTLAESQQGMLYLYNFADASEHSFVSIEIIHTTETPEYYAMMGGFVLTNNQATDGIQFVANSGNIASGTFTLYKVI
tara:strand:- start:44 stop:580 length:537 start_codon:yes stop_codon:yes gene_type:complete